MQALSVTFLNLTARLTMRVQIFELTCPHAIGFAADDCLGTVVANYIKEELDAADREERPPQVERFPNTFLEDLAPDPNNADAFVSLTPQATSHALPQVKPATVIIINTEGNPQPYVKMLQSQELPPQLVERLLGDPTDSQSALVVNRDYRRVCAMRWDSHVEGYLFNGRLGQYTGELKSAPKTWLQALDYWPALPYGPRPGDPDVSSDQDVRRWSPKGEKPGIKQWLTGIRDIETIEPHDEADLPRDAKRMLASAVTTFQTAPPGRMRVPQGVSLMPVSEADDEDSEEVDLEGVMNFDQLLKLGGGRSGQPCNTRNHDVGHVAGPPNDDEEGEARPFSSLLGKRSGVHELTNKVTPKAGPVEGIGPTRASVLSMDRATSDQFTPHPILHQSIPTSRPAESNACVNESTTTEAMFYSNGPKSAHADRMGLKGSASVQARWELQNRQKQQLAITTAGSVQRLRLREPLQDQVPSAFHSAPMSLSTGQDPEACPPSHCPDPAPKWESLLAPTADPESGDLIDVSPGVHKPAAEVDVPPGLQPLPGVEELPTSENDTAQRPDARVTSATSTQREKQVLASVVYHPRDVATSAPAPAPEETLIDFSEGEITLAALPRAQLSFSAAPLTPSRQQIRADKSVSGMQIRERLADEPEELHRTYTMRQKAPKKYKSQVQSKPSGTKPKAQLPLPDPAPPARKKKEGEGKAPQKPAKEGTTTKSRPLPIQACGSSMVSEKQPYMVEDTPMPPDTAGAEPKESMLASLTKVLDATRTANTMSHIVMQFGKTYLHSPSGRPADVMQPVALAKQLCSVSSPPKTTFGSRLTQRDAEAFRLFNLSRSPLNVDLSPNYFYEVQIRSTEGQIHVLKWFLSEQPDGQLADDGTPSPTLHFSTMNTCIMADAHILFPSRPFDAHISVEIDALDDDKAMRAQFSDFISSARCLFVEGQQVPYSARSNPSFAARIPIGLRVDKVLLHVSLRQRLADGVYLVLDRVDKMKLQSVTARADGCNVEATLDPGDSNSAWWEAKMVLPPTVGPAALLTRAEDFVAQMDGVGFTNQGPWCLGSDVQGGLGKGKAREVELPYW